MSNLLSVNGLEAYYGATQALHGMTFHVAEGGITAMLGANGAGKSTTLRAVCGMVRTKGEITYAGQRIDAKATEDIVRLGIGHVVEGRGTFVNLSVEENLRLGAYTRRNKDEVREDEELIFTLFPVLAQRRHQQAGTLSGGEQQMLAVSRALMLRPRLLLLDEPSFGLAPLVVEEIFTVLGDINKRRGVSMLLVEQNASAALALASQAFLLETGRVVMSGPAEEIRNDEAVRKSYLGY